MVIFSISLWLEDQIQAAAPCATSCVWAVNYSWSTWNMYIRIQMLLASQVLQILNDNMILYDNKNKF